MGQGLVGAKPVGDLRVAKGTGLKGRRLGRVTSSRVQLGGEQTMAERMHAAHRDHQHRATIRHRAIFPVGPARRASCTRPGGRRPRPLEQGAAQACADSRRAPAPTREPSRRLPGTSVVSFQEPFLATGHQRRSEACAIPADQSSSRKPAIPLHIQLFPASSAHGVVVVPQAHQEDPLFRFHSLRAPVGWMTSAISSPRRFASLTLSGLLVSSRTRSAPSCWRM